MKLKEFDKKMYAELEKRGKIKIEKLAIEHDVSTSKVRRSFRKLARAGLCTFKTENQIVLQDKGKR